MPADSVGFAEPSKQFFIEVTAGTDAEMVNVVAGRERFNFGETRIFEATRQNHMADEAMAAKADGGEAHAYLKGDAGLFGHDAHGAAAFDASYKSAKQRDGRGSLARQMLPKGVARTKVGLIAVREEAFANRAIPERGWLPGKYATAQAVAPAVGPCRNVFQKVRQASAESLV